MKKVKDYKRIIKNGVFVKLDFGKRLSQKKLNAIYKKIIHK
jgi:hypothetical protein